MTKPRPRVSRKGASQHQDQRRPVAKGQGEVFPADEEDFFHASAPSIAQRAAGQVQEDRFQVGFVDIHRADLDAVRHWRS